ncbi:MAG: type II toxin-antitoxin system RelE/ParE family toxin [Verrucomicrobiae bacterium]|nr:type II toxin-antitoxin system RelE/ParE family toxin [Verrucomicrobiae bacterium]
MAGCVLSPYAEQDLESIYTYTVKHHGLNQLDIYAGKIDRAIDEITQDPMRLHNKARDDLLEGCRSYRVEHYLFYRVRSGRVEIGRVLHEAMNFEAHISDEVFEP